MTSDFANPSQVEQRRRNREELRKEEADATLRRMHEEQQAWKYNGLTDDDKEFLSEFLSALTTLEKVKRRRLDYKLVQFLHGQNVDNLPRLIAWLSLLYQVNSHGDFEQSRDFINASLDCERRQQRRRAARRKNARYRAGRTEPDYVDT